MSKDIKFNIKLSVDGKEQVVTASTNIKELASQLGITEKKAKGVESAFSLISFNQLREAVQNLSGAFSRLSGSMGETLRANNLIQQLTGESGDGMLRLRNGVQAVADYFGKDFSEVLRSVNNLSKGFGISAQEALKLVRDGLVSGADAGGDFLDTVREYPRYFKEAGLSAEEFIAISTNAAKQGIYSDKGVDAIKEGNIRIREMTTATRDALEGIGISADAVMQGLQAGSLTTFQVMQMVAARLAELPASSSSVGAALADIFGGPGEDAGLEYIKTLATVETSMDAVKAATGETAEAQERVISANEKLKNGLSSLVDLSNVYSNVQPYVEMAAQLGIVISGISSLTAVLKGVNIQYRLYQARALAGRAATLLFGRQAVAAATSSTALGVSLTGASRAAVLLRGALRAAFITSGIGIAVLALTEGINLLMGRMDEASEKADRMSESEEDYKQAAASAKVEIDKEVASLRELINSKADTSAAVERLNERYGEAFGTYRTAAEWYDVLTSKGMAYVRMKGYEAQAVKLASQMAERQAAAELNRQKREQLTREGRDTVQRYRPGTGPGTPGSYYTEVSREMKQAIEEANALNDEIIELDRQLAAVEKHMAGQATLLGTPAAGKRQTEGNKKTTGAVSVPVRIEKPEPEEAKTYVETLQSMLADAQRRFGDALTVEARVEAQAEVEALQRRIDEATRGKLSIEAEVRPSYVEQGSREDLRQSYANAESQARTIQNDYEIGLIGKEEAEAELAALNAQVQELGLNPIEIQFDTEGIEQFTEEIHNVGQEGESVGKSLAKGWSGLKSMAGGIESITSALRGNGDAWQAVTGIVDGFISLYNGLQTVISIIGALTGSSLENAGAKGAEATAETAASAARLVSFGIAQSTVPMEVALNKTLAASYQELAAAEFMAAHASIPFVGFGIASNFIGQMIAVVKSTALAAATPFAAGGIVSGPTLALVGEYGGAGNNPEVIAPLDRLRSLLGQSAESGGSGRVEFEIKGRTLVGILEKESNIRNRS